MASNPAKPENDLKVIDDEDALQAEVNGLVEAEQEAFLFDSALVTSLDFSHLAEKNFRPAISPANPGDGLRVRSLGSGDYDRGFIPLLQQLTKFDSYDKAMFLKQFYLMKSMRGSYFVTVIEDTELNKVIGSATMVIERKFIHKCATKGIIEDVVVSKDYQGKQLGKLLIATLIELGKSLGCYKISLNCVDDMVKFYTKLGFVQEESNANFLQLRTGIKK